MRQGALDSLVQEGLAAAGGVPLAAVRRAAMMAGSTVAVSSAALTGGEEALARVRARGRPAGAADARLQRDPVAAAMAKAGGGEVAVDTKLDGIRIQVHRAGDEVIVATRSLEDITDRLPEVVAVARALPADDVRARRRGAGARRRRPAAAVPGDRVPHRAWRDAASTSRRTSSTCCTSTAPTWSTPPAHERLAALDAAGARGAPGAAAGHRRRRRGRGVRSPACSPRGHEGVVVKNLDAPYDAGRRGSAWVKVKPVHTLDLVVLAVEWGSGRRKGWLSNIHLGARDPATAAS